MTSPASSSSRSSTLSLVLVGGLFFIFGAVTWLNGSLIPFLKLTCELRTDGQALLVTFAFYMSYFFLALPSAHILRRTGMKRGMSLGLWVMALGALLFLPAAWERSYPVFLAGLFVQGMGLALLQTASNPYISVLGPIESAARRISIMGICNKVAGALSPLVLSAWVLGRANDTVAELDRAASSEQKAALLQELSNRLVAPYAALAGVLVLLGLWVRSSPLPNLDPAVDEGAHAAEAEGKTSLFAFPHLWLGVICIFVYVGVEVMAGDVITVYGKALGLSFDESKVLTTYTLVSMLVGYSIGIFTIPRFVSQARALQLSAVAGLVLALGAYLTEGRTSILLIALLGLANALMWPAIFPMAIDGLGRFTQLGSACLIMGIAGGAVLPQVYAVLAEHTGHQAAFFVCVLPCYLYILYFASHGHRVGRPGARSHP